MTPAIEVENVGHRFDKGAPWLFQGLDLTVPSATSAVVMGRSGSGKSTLLSLMLGLYKPAQGRVNVLGADWAEMSASQRPRHRAQHVGVVFQFGELIDELTPLENVILPALWAGAKPIDAKARGQELLDRLRVRTTARTTSLVSGGERQRIAVARALINSPEVLVADEPTGALDQDSAETMADLIFDLPASQGCALVVVTHSHSLAERADSVLHIPTPADEAGP